MSATRETDRQIVRLAIPAFGALIAEPLYILTDTAIVGRLGSDQLGGLAVASALLLIALNAFTFLAYGTTSAVARLLGAGEQRAAAHQAVQSLWLALAVGVALIGAGWALTDPLLRVLGADGDVLVNGRIYLRVSLFGLPGMLVMLAGVGYLRGLQNTTRPLVIAVGTAIVNVVIEVILIFGFDYGIGASALATVIAQWSGALIYIATIRSSAAGHGVATTPDLSIIRTLAVTGVHLFIRTWALRGAFTVATAVAARLSTTDLAAHQITFEIWAFLAYGLDALAIAAQALVGAALGAGDVSEARRVGNRVIRWAALLGIALLVAMFALRDLLPDIFTNEPAVAALASFLLIHLALQQPLNGIVFALDGILIGAGDMAYLAKAMLLAAIVFTPAALGVLWFDLGIGWLWGAIWVLMAARAAALAVRYRSDRWQVTGT